MRKIRCGLYLCLAIIISCGLAIADDGKQQIESFLVFQAVDANGPVPGSRVSESSVSEDNDSDRFKGLTDAEIIDALREIASKTSREWRDWDRSQMGFGEGGVPGLQKPSSGNEKRPVLPPALLVAGMAAQALDRLDNGTCTRCYFGQVDSTGRQGFDIRWMDPISGVPNAYNYKGFEDFPLDPGTVSEIPPDPDMIVDAASRIFEVISNPGTVIDSYYESGGAVNFYYVFTYDLGNGPRAFYTWDVRVMQIGG